VGGSTEPINSSTRENEKRFQFGFSKANFGRLGLGKHGASSKNRFGGKPQTKLAPNQTASLSTDHCSIRRRISPGRTLIPR
jgi:hypothetical protein